jgi:hypothetical protein
MAALALFFLTRSTLVSPRLRDAFGRHADVLAASIAALWAAESASPQPSARRGWCSACRWPCNPTGTVAPGKAGTLAFGGAATLTLAAVLVLVALTQERNRIYATPGGVWLDVIEKGRAGTRTYWNLALACDTHDGFDAAMRYADEVFSTNHDLDVYEHLAKRRLGQGDAATAERYLRHAVETQGEAIAKGELVAVRTAAYLAMILTMQGKSAEARSLAATYLERVQATLGNDHPWTRELIAIRAEEAADADRSGSDHERSRPPATR